MFATALTLPAPAQISVYIGHPPPQVRYERRGPLPGPGYAWVNGYWSPQGGRFQWVPGRWDRPPYQGARWTRPRYDTTSKAGSCVKVTGIVTNMVTAAITEVVVQFENSKELSYRSAAFSRKESAATLLAQKQIPRR